MQYQYNNNNDNNKSHKFARCLFFQPYFCVPAKITAINIILHRIQIIIVILMATIMAMIMKNKNQRQFHVTPVLICTKMATVKERRTAIFRSIRKAFLL